MIEAFLKGITLGLLLSIAVGPVMFSIIKQSLNNGHKGGMAFVIGVSASDITMVLVSNVFTQLFSAISTHKLEIGIAGSIFLISMGIFFLFFKKVKVNEEGQQVFLKFRKRDYARIAMAGYLMNTLNPAIFLLSTTILKKRS
jgi:threonine/homoserine/homoserine lactone efflux protein